MLNFIKKCKNIFKSLFSLTKIEKNEVNLCTNGNDWCYNSNNAVGKGGVDMTCVGIANKADAIRKKYNLYSLPIDISKITKSLNIDVIVRDLSDLEKHAGRKISGLIRIDKENENKLIFINSCDIPARRTFTLAHELGHYYLHAKKSDSEKVLISFRGLNSEQEREANLFAAALLMPEEKVREEYNAAFMPTKSYLADIFGVSSAAMEVRLNKLGLSYVG